jgi:hypothetical protein
MIPKERLSVSSLVTIAAMPRRMEPRLDGFHVYGNRMMTMKVLDLGRRKYRNLPRQLVPGGW